MAQIVDVPGYGEVEFPDDMTDEQIVAAIRRNIAPPSAADTVKRQGGLLARSLADSAAALPLAALEGGAGVANLLRRGTKAITEPDGNFSFRQQWTEGLDKAGLPRPETTFEKVSDAGVQAIAASRIPVPTGQPQVPQNFVPKQSLRTDTLLRSQNEGYVVPPTTSNPTLLNRGLEGMAGKLTTAQMASAKNTEVTNSLAKRALQLSDDAPITPESLAALRAEAGKAYGVVKGSGVVTADDAFASSVRNAVSQYQGAGKDFATLSRSDLQSVADDLIVPLEGTTARQFDASSAVDATRTLRDMADAAFRSGDKAAGKAYRAFSDAIENLLERHLASIGDDAGLDALRAARTLIAKSYTVEKALNPSTGNVSATKLAQQLTKGKPLSGELKTAAQFGQAFPKAARDFNESLPGISPLDFYAAGGITAATQKPWALLYPFVRVGTRAGLLSPMGQNLAIPGQQLPQPWAVGATAGLLGP